MDDKFSLVVDCDTGFLSLHYTGSLSGLQKYLEMTLKEWRERDEAQAEQAREPDTSGD